jgi:hypothetical protein
MSNATPLEVAHVPTAPNQHMSVQSMSSMEIDPPISMNTPLVQIIISKSDAQQTLINISTIQMGPLINPPNIVVDNIGDITLELSAGPHMITNTSAPQVVDPSPSSFTVVKPKKSIECDSNFDHALIS